MYPYDNFADEGHDEDITLRSSVNEVSEALEKEIDERLSIAGIEVLGSSNWLLGICPRNCKRHAKKTTSNCNCCR